MARYLINRLVLPEYLYIYSAALIEYVWEGGGRDTPCLYVQNTYGVPAAVIMNRGKIEKLISYQMNISWKLLSYITIYLLYEPYRTPPPPHPHDKVKRDNYSRPRKGHKLSAYGSVYMCLWEIDESCRIGGCWGGSVTVCVWLNVTVETWINLWNRKYTDDLFRTVYKYLGNNNIDMFSQKIIAKFSFF